MYSHINQLVSQTQNHSKKHMINQSNRQGTNQSASQALCPSVSQSHKHRLSSEDTKARKYCQTPCPSVNHTNTDSVQKTQKPGSTVKHSVPLSTTQAQIKSRRQRSQEILSNTMSLGQPHKHRFSPENTKARKYC